MAGPPPRIKRHGPLPIVLRARICAFVYPAYVPCEMTLLLER